MPVKAANFDRKFRVHIYMYRSRNDFGILYVYHFLRTKVLRHFYHSFGLISMVIDVSSRKKHSKVLVYVKKLGFSQNIDF